MGCKAGKHATHNTAHPWRSGWFVNPGFMAHGFFDCAHTLKQVRPAHGLCGSVAGGCSSQVTRLAGHQRVDEVYRRLRKAQEEGPPAPMLVDLLDAMGDACLVRLQLSVLPAARTD